MIRTDVVRTFHAYLIAVVGENMTLLRRSEHRWWSSCSLAHLGTVLHIPRCPKSSELCSPNLPSRITQYFHLICVTCRFRRDLFHARPWYLRKQAALACVGTLPLKLPFLRFKIIVLACVDLRAQFIRLDGVSAAMPSTKQARKGAKRASDADKGTNLPKKGRISLTQM